LILTIPLMNYDLIIVARSSTERLKQITQNCINSAIIGGNALNVVLVETFSATKYSGVDHYVTYNGLFGYNGALNKGLERASGDIHILANNDLIFHEGWHQIGEDMKNNGFDSASAWFNGSCFEQGDYIYEGFGIAIHLTGWCLFITREAHEKIGKLNEEVEFWYSDNVYAIQLREHGLRHGMFCNVRVDHIGSQTLNTMSYRLKRQYSEGQIIKFNRLCGKKRS